MLRALRFRKVLALSALTIPRIAPRSRAPAILPQPFVFRSFFLRKNGCILMFGAGTKSGPSPASKLASSPCAFCSYDTTDRSALSRFRDPSPIIRIPLVFPAEKRLHTHVFSSSKCKDLSASELAPSPCAWNSCITYFPQIGLLIRRSIRVRTGVGTGLGRRGR